MVCDTMICENTYEETTDDDLQLGRSNVHQPEMQTAEEKVRCLVTEEHQRSNTPTTSLASPNLNEETID